MNYESLLSDINDFINQSPLRGVAELGLENIFDPPMIGIANAADPLFLKFKDPSVVGNNYLLPEEWLPGAQAVISYFLPFSEKIRRANRNPGLPAREWLYGRIEGQVLNEDLSKHIGAMIKESGGGEALVPALDPRFEVVGLISNWSERHTAFIAGLGTFSLSRSLITEKGCAGRYGSIITSLNLPVTKRQYSEVYEYCSFCGQCLERCPAGAIKPVDGEKRAGMDKSICQDYLDRKIRPRFKPRYGCGKCQTAVQCEYQIPGRES